MRPESLPFRKIVGGVPTPTLRVRGAVLALAVGLLLGAQGCALFFKPPAVEIVGVEVLSLGLSSGTAEVSLDVTNDQSRQMEIRGFLYEVDVRGPGEDGGWTALAEGFLDRRLSLPGRETVRVKVPVPFKYDALGEAVMSLLSSGEVPYRLRGEVWVGGSAAGLQIPFRHQGVIKP